MNNHPNPIRRAAGIAVLATGLLAGAVPLTALASSTPARAPTEQSRPARRIDHGRIEFAPGTSSGSVNGAVNRGDWHHWAARAQRGQTIEVTIAAQAGNATFEVYSPAGDQMANDVTSFRGRLPASGLYAIDVGSTGGLANYTLNVTITGEPARQAPSGGGHFRGRMQFAPGNDSGSVSGHVAGGDWDAWSFKAFGGQTVNMSVSTGAGRATFSLYAPNGDPLAAHTTSFTGTLPATGLYMIEVGGGRGSADYTINLQITGERNPAAPAAPQPPAGGGHFQGRIQMAASARAGSVSGTVARGNWHEWSFRAEAGQIAIVRVTAAAGSTFSLYAPNGDVVTAHTTSFRGTLPATGLYMVEVGPTGGTANYTLDVAFDGWATPAPAPGPAPGSSSSHFQGRIQFALGADSGSVGGSVSSGDWDEWSFKAFGGQTVTMTVSASAGRATFSLYAPNGDPLAAHTTSFTGTLPATGLYMIEVGPGGGGANYNIHLQIT